MKWICLHRHVNTFYTISIWPRGLRLIWVNSCIAVTADVDIHSISHAFCICSLRTSETNYLNEAYQFYAAIRGRAYYSRAIKEDRPDLMVKKLRYYARFIVVCLLLKKMKLVRELIVELDKQVQEYTTTWVPHMSFNRLNGYWFCAMLCLQIWTWRSTRMVSCIRGN